MSHHYDRDDARFDEHGNTRPSGSNYIVNDKSDDGLDRRGFLRCMAWAGTATLWGLAGWKTTSFVPPPPRWLIAAIKRRGMFFPTNGRPHKLYKYCNQDYTPAPPR